MPRLISRAELARLRGVSASAVTKACKHQLEPACVGRRIDLDHPAAQNYLGNKDQSPTATAPAPERRRAQSTATPPKRPTGATPRAAKQAPPAAQNAADDGKQKGVRVQTHVVDSVDAIGDMTVREVVRKFGTVVGFKDWLVTLKQIEDIREKRLKNEEHEGTLISRELVQTHVFGAIDAGNRRLLSDTPKTMARRIYALAKSGADIEEAERTVRGIISSQLEPVKTQAAKVLRNG